jgi:peptidoglycan/LPS O-acetylase OafA/YrhL
MGTKGDLIGGWSIDAAQLRIGFTRLLYPFFAGVLLSRIGKFIHVKGAFWVCSLLICISLSVPRIGGTEHLWMNGIYESFCIILIFPLIVSIGAGGSINGRYSRQICKFLADISYPMYITHYPLIYVYTAWVANNNIPMERGLLGGLILLVASIAIAYVCLKLYDEPVRDWLKKKYLIKQKTVS